MKKLIVFDLDGTLADSKLPIDEDMAILLNELLKILKVAIISGGDWIQFQKQVVEKLPKETNLKNLTILPTCGTKFYGYETEWKKLYSDDLTKDEKTKILDSLKQAITQAKLTIKRTWGEQIEDRESQITFSALGQHAPLSEKIMWDPNFVKREKIKEILDTLIPNFSVRLGGTTSIDITKPGIDKSYGIKKLHDIYKIHLSEMIFIGDAIFPGGNDYPVKEMGVASIHIANPTETKRVVEAIIACMDDRQLTTFRDVEKLLGGH